MDERWVNDLLDDLTDTINAMQSEIDALWAAIGALTEARRSKASRPVRKPEYIEWPTKKHKVETRWDQYE